jgi:hypothetical protein
MKNEQRGTGILQQAAAALSAAGVPARVEAALSRTVDGVLVVALDGGERRFDAEIKLRLSRPEVGAAIARLQRPEKSIIVAPTISAATGEALRQHGINYADTSGNAWIRARGMLVSTAGRRARATPQNLGRDRAFRPAGLRVTFTLLSVPELLNAPYRDIAHGAGTALGSIPPVLESLEKNEHIKEIRGERRFVNKEKLIADWAQAYARVMLERGILGRFAAPAPNWWRAVAVEKDGALWGGDVAAARLARNLVPAEFIIYAPELPRRLIADSRLHASMTGEVVIRRKYWRFQHELERKHRVVPPLLIYAELLANGDARSVDAAKEIHARYLA